MGLGLFMLGRSLSAVDRNAAIRERREAAFEEADRADWQVEIANKTVLGHPRVRAQIDESEWYTEIDWTYSWTKFVLYVVFFVAGFLAIIVFGLGYEAVTGTHSGLKGAPLGHVFGAVVWIVSASGMSAFGAQAALRRRFLRRVDAGFAAQGWPVPQLRAEMAAHAETVKQQQREANRLRRQGRDPRLFPRL